MIANKRMKSGISIREAQVRKWLKKRNFSGEYLLVSTKPDASWSQKLHKLPREIFLMVDLYTPVLLEKALTFRIWSPRDWVIRENQRNMVRRFLKRGNHFLVANRRQREYWIDESLSLGVPLHKTNISVFPTGSALTINHQPSTINNRKVVLWFGGIYPWMDPEPLIRAFGRVHKKFPNWTLRILGGFQPATGYEHRYRRIIRLARKTIDAQQLHIVEWKNETWMRRYLKDVVFAVHLVKHTPEDYYAHRVRLLTLLNFGIGVLTSGHDVISNLLIEMKAGEMVRKNVEDVAKNLSNVMTSDRVVRTWNEHAPNVQREFITREQSDTGFDKVFRRFLPTRRSTRSEKRGVL